jgi:hypothetical protein
MTTKAQRNVWRLDRDGRVSPQASGLDWRVIAADQSRVDPTAEYLFCAPDFLFPVDGLARALRLEVDPRPRIDSDRRAHRGSRSAKAMNSGG